jgi:hypothetical protein
VESGAAAALGIITGSVCKSFVFFRLALFFAELEISETDCGCGGCGSGCGSKIDAAGSATFLRPLFFFSSTSAMIGWGSGSTTGFFLLEAVLDFDFCIGKKLI